MQHYDLAIIGGGISGLMAAIRMIQNKADAKVILLEKGPDIEKRVCPILTGKSKTCLKCKHCAIMEGLAGAGAFSDGKYVISTEYGGWLPDFLPKETVLSYIEQADEIMRSFGATSERFLPDDELKKQCLAFDLHMSQAQIKHLGTDANYETMKKLVCWLKERIEIKSLCNVTDVDIDKHLVHFSEKDTNESIEAETVLFAVGRSGSRFFADWCNKNKIPLNNNQVDIGVRVELPSEVWEHFSKKIYEPKIWYRSKQYGDMTRMFCFNERGQVVVENTSGVLTVNGHAYVDEAKKSRNSNFALLSTIRFTQPFRDPIEYARSVAGLANLISGGTVLVQRLGDLLAGQRTDAKRLAQSSVTPTLQAVAGDLSLCLPKRQLDNILETLQALNQVAPGTTNYDTLLYGVECKYYSARPECKNFELAGTTKIYAAGDGAGFTRSLSQAAANGLLVADLICRGNVKNLV